MQWVAKPSYMEELELEEEAAQQACLLRSGSTLTDPGLIRRTSYIPRNEEGNRDRSATDQLDAQRRTVAFGEQVDIGRRTFSFEINRGAHEQEGRATTAATSMESRGRQEQFPKDGDSPATVAFMGRRTTIRSTRVGQKPKADGGGRQLTQNASASEPFETIDTFKHSVTSRFLTSLRNFGDVRYAELEEGFKNVSLEEQLAAGRDVDGAVGVGGDESRPSSAAGSQWFETDIARPGSSPAVLTGQKRPMSRFDPNLARPGSSPAMPRINSAPSQVGDRANRRGSLSSNQLRPPNSNGFPNIDCQRWGFEAADRFRLFSTVRSGKNNQRHLAGCCGGGSTDGMGYKCQLCQRQHVMLTSF